MKYSVEAKEKKEHVKHVHELVHKHLEANNTKYKAAADAHSRRCVFDVGDYIWARLTKDRVPAG